MNRSPRRPTLSRRPAGALGLALLAAASFAPPARGVVFIPSESFTLPLPYIHAQTEVSAFNLGASVLSDSDSSTGDPTQQLVAASTSRIVPGADTSTAVDAYAVVRSNPFGGLSMGWSNSILGTPVHDFGSGPETLESRRSSTILRARNHFAVDTSAGVTDVDIDLVIDGRVAFAFDRPLSTLPQTANAFGSLSITASLWSTRYGEVSLFTDLFDDTGAFETVTLSQLAPGVHNLGLLELTVTDILEAGQVVGKTVDYVATLSAEDAVFAQSGDRLALELNLSARASYDGTELLYYNANFDRTLLGSPTADTAGTSFATVVPLPASAWLLGSALVAALGWARGRRPDA